MVSNKSEPQILSFASTQAWRNWLDKNYSLQEGIWLRIYKKASEIPTVTYAEALDDALCYGWIDGQKKPYDANSWLQRFTPRRPKSVWSQRNREHVARLITEGKMHESGLRQIEAAKADGRWENAYASQSTITIPEDFQQALEKNPKALAFFNSLTKSQRYSFLYRIHHAKKPETRALKIKQFITMLANSEKI